MNKHCVKVSKVHGMYPINKGNLRPPDEDEFSPLYIRDSFEIFARSPSGFYYDVTQASGVFRDLEF